MDLRIAALAAKQHGLFTRRQALAAAGRGLIEQRLEAGRWRRVHRGVYRLTGAPQTREQAILAACLAAGPFALASHSIAAELWRLPGFEGGPIEISVPRGRWPRLPNVVIHTSAHLTKRDGTVIGVIPVTSPARTLSDLAASVEEGRLEEATMRWREAWSRSPP